MTKQLKRKKLKSTKEFFSTGCTILDLAITNKLPGGFPGGRISHVYGEKSTTKSALAIEPLGAAQRKGGLARACRDHSGEKGRRQAYHGRGFPHPQPRRRSD